MPCNGTTALFAFHYSNHVKGYTNVTAKLTYQYPINFHKVSSSQRNYSLTRILAFTDFRLCSRQAHTRTYQYLINFHKVSSSQCNYSLTRIFAFADFRLCSRQAHTHFYQYPINFHKVVSKR